MTWFFISIVAFLAGHILPGLFRRQLVAALGTSLYLFAFSAISIGLLVWVIAAELNADYIALWPYDPRSHWVPLVAMLPVCWLWVAALRQPCPLSIGRAKGYDPAHPGINRFTRHPLLLGVFIWGTAHLFPNGHLAAAIFFGGSALFALLGMGRMEKMRLRQLGAAEFDRLSAGTRRFYVPGLLKGALDWRDVLGGIILYGVILALHPLVLGRDPLAF
ncbi:NnrU family protein [Thalassospira sp. TSL5-1]|uniref:NnrU family protein n=1 Tax=Thalassospira sp. TSL5-1 TaxID=1544451 RepID=UPI000939E6F4|nr:NnrU family protein [Thalassospira sp. TSL5-1]OKH87941.1 NnrU family protein [Thalassospira sp. TSL5-1]